jgi:hypothetical protein
MVESFTHAKFFGSDAYLSTDKGEVYAWGWKACAVYESLRDQTRRLRSPIIRHGDPRGTPSCPPRTCECPIGSEQQEAVKKYGASAEHHRRIGQSEIACRDTLSSNKEIQSELCTQRLDTIVNSLKQSALDLREAPQVDNPNSISDTVISKPSVVSFCEGVNITSVAAGGRHTLALSGEGSLICVYIVISVPNLAFFSNFSNLEEKTAKKRWLRKCLASTCGLSLSTLSIGYRCR